MRGLREQLGLSQEAVGVAIGIDESSSRARISRYELGVHEPPVPTARLIAGVLGAPETVAGADGFAISIKVQSVEYIGCCDLILIEITIPVEGSTSKVPENGAP
jgi:transcriptional regulator with XRE-family HTH domain